MSDNKVRVLNNAPTWSDAWNLWLELGKIDDNTYRLFLPAMVNMDAANEAEGESDAPEVNEETDNA